MDELDKQLFDETLTSLIKNPKEDQKNTQELEAERKMFSELAKIEGFKQYLVETLARDVKRYFSYSEEHKETVRGAYSRTLDFYNKLVKNSD